MGEAQREGRQGELHDAMCCEEAAESRRRQRHPQGDGATATESIGEHTAERSSTNRAGTEGRDHHSGSARAEPALCFQEDGEEGDHEGPQPIDQGRTPQAPEEPGQTAKRSQARGSIPDRTIGAIRP